MNDRFVCAHENYPRSRIRLIHPQLINPAAYSIQIAWKGIFLLL